MQVIVELCGKVSLGAEVADANILLEQHLDAVMEELLTLGATDPELSINFSDRSVRIGVLVEAANPIEAVESAAGVLRSAIHAAGGATPHWPEADSGAWGFNLTGTASNLVESDDRELVGA